MLTWPFATREGTWVRAVAMPARSMPTGDALTVASRATPFVPDETLQATVRQAMSLADFLYEASLFGLAEELDALLEEVLEWLDETFEYLDVESWDDGDWVTGIEDYEVDECEPVPWSYWEPDMLVTSEFGS